MKAEIDNLGYLNVTAETNEEAWALRHIFSVTVKCCDKCGELPSRLNVDTSILEEG